MTIKPILSAIDYAARKLTTQKSEEWCSIGALHKQELSDLMCNLARDLYKSRSSTKVIDHTMRNLESFYSKKEVRGSIIKRDKRHIVFDLAYPLAIDDGLGFCHLKVEVNARSGLYHATESEPIIVSTHALQRVFQRLDFKNESSVLDEIYSSMKIFPAWKVAALEVKAKSWPVLSKTGFFIAARVDDSITSTLITWMKPDQLSKKWGLVYDNIISLSENNPNLMTDPNFIKEFLISFPWLMFEHSPEADLQKLAWESKDTASGSLGQTGNEIESSKGVNITNHKSSISYIPGINYKDSPPPFKSHTQHLGVVVQKRPSGEMIVSFNDSWVGKIPSTSNKKTNELLPNLNELFVGDKLSVEVRKIGYIESEQGYLIYLDRTELANALWEGVQEKYRVGQTYSGVILSEVGLYFSVKFEGGVCGLVPANQVKFFLASADISTKVIIGLNLNFTVSGYKYKNKKLMLEILESKERIFDSLVENAKLNPNLKGKVIRKYEQFALIELEAGLVSMLHQHNCWGQSLPDENKIINVRIINIDNENHKILVSLQPPLNVSKTFPAIPTDDERWAKFIDTYKEGDNVLVQIISIVEMGYLAAMQTGYFGLLLFKEATWSSNEINNKYEYQLGDFLEVKISSIKPKHRRIFFSRKTFLPHPLESFSKQADFTKKYRGTVSNIAEYGYFITLDYGFDGLLHKNNVPESTVLLKGDQVEVYLSEIDLDKKRVALSILPVKRNAET